MFSLIKSIRYFEEEGIKNFEKLEENFIKNPTDIATYVIGVTKEVHKLGLMIIKETLELMNQKLCDSPIRKRNWEINKHVDKQLITSLGTVTFRKTLFRNKKTRKSEYLLDKIMNRSEHERITEDAMAKMYEEAVQTSYRRGGEETSIETSVSKETVKNKLHTLQFPKPEAPKEKKVVEYLYIDADEDHASLQFKENKGDLVISGNGRKNNCLITKLVYVYEGVIPEAPKSKRNKLVNPYYFCRVCSGKANDEFWDEIYQYLDSHYDLAQVKRIYLNSDGGAWILSGKRRIAGVVHVLDEFHLQKYITKMTSHMKDSIDDAKDELMYAIRRQGKEDFKRIVERLKDVSDETGQMRIEESANYILANWTASRTRLLHRDGVMGSSTEGHVSHVLASRMSSRPMGWSELGAAKMAELIAYSWNGGDMLELAKHQKKCEQLPMAAGAEEITFSSTELMLSERNKHSQVGKYLSSITHSTSDLIKKYMWFNAHIWGM